MESYIGAVVSAVLAFAGAFWAVSIGIGRAGVGHGRLLERVDENRTRITKLEERIEANYAAQGENRSNVAWIRSTLDELKSNQRSEYQKFHDRVNKDLSPVLARIENELSVLKDRDNRDRNPSYPPGELNIRR